jgi:hypothetical protein
MRNSRPDLETVIKAGVCIRTARAHNDTNSPFCPGQNNCLRRRCCTSVQFLSFQKSLTNFINLGLYFELQRCGGHGQRLLYTISSLPRLTTEPLSIRLTPSTPSSRRYITNSNSRRTPLQDKQQASLRTLARSLTSVYLDRDTRYLRIGYANYIFPLFSPLILAF